ncbi:MAG: hypothetical protein JHC93_06240 [Parachlamydiales bacterium]|nr:hypothetical protein [Parachlamydiales bacterium]
MKRVLSFIIDCSKSFVLEFHSLARFYKFIRHGCNDHTNYDEHNAPVILIHGIYGHKAFWNEFRKHLEFAGVNNIHVIQLHNSQLGVKDHANQLKDHINVVLGNNRERGVKLIGASRGGVVAAYFTEFVAEDIGIDVKAVVTIGSPLSGTLCANVLPRVVARDMGYRSSFIIKLREKILENCKTHYYHIATRTDPVIIPYHSALTGKDKNKEFLVSGQSHNSLLFDHSVIHRVISWLQNC